MAGPFRLRLLLKFAFATAPQPRERVLQRASSIWRRPHVPPRQIEQNASNSLRSLRLNNSPQGRWVCQCLICTSTETFRGIIHTNVERGSAVSTDEHASYGLLGGNGYDHHGVNHSKKRWRKYNYRRNEYHHTNSVKSFWKLFKNSVRSTHIHVSPKYMDRYLKEFTFRSNHREMSNAMFDLLISAV